MKPLNLANPKAKKCIVVPEGLYFKFTDLVINNVNTEADKFSESVSVETEKTPVVVPTKMYFEFVE